jgi:hypothetical protein
MKMTVLSLTAQMKQTELSEPFCFVPFGPGVPLHAVEDMFYRLLCLSVTTVISPLLI